MARLAWKTKTEVVWMFDSKREYDDYVAVEVEGNPKKGSKKRPADDTFYVDGVFFAAWHFKKGG